MRPGLTENIEAIIERVAALECLRPYVLVGGTALAMQLGHRKSEDLDFMQWRRSKTDKPEIDWPRIERELREKIGEIERFDMLGFDQVEFVVAGVKFSFYVSDNPCPIAEPVAYLGAIRLADVTSILAMKLEVMLRRAKLRDYYDIYSILRAGYSLSEGMDKALKYARHRLTTKNLVMLLLSDAVRSDERLAQLDPLYKVSKEEMRQYILLKIREL